MDTVTTLAGQGCRIVSSPTPTVPHPDDDRNRAILAERAAARAARTGPQIGDWVLYPDDAGRGEPCPHTGHVWSAQVERFSHDWGDEMQTSPGGSFHLGANGGASFSGALNPPIPVADLVDTGETRPARFWFFDHDHAGAHRGVDCLILCRVWRYAPAAKRTAEQIAQAVADRNATITEATAATVADLLAMQHATGHTYDQLTTARDQAVSALLAGAVAIIKATSYVEGYEAPDTDALGIAIAHHFRWDSRVVECARSALEDANFHGVNRAIAAEVEAWDKIA